MKTALGFAQVAGDFRTSPEISCKLWETSAHLRWFLASCIRLPQSSGGFAQIVGDFRRSPEV
ncbi:hypothetical protein [Chryseobacterium profundimaris]|uniref:hypothetical protein n=1 Tax=Chryseobacterium profundimaris TaxID=1387275 RepID=UPI0024B74CC1|nr:hypothetical protein [Chryseobacterium profundimaris]